MTGSDFGPLVEVEVVFAHKQLNVVELSYPSALSNCAKLTVVGITRERGIDLTEVAISKLIIHH